MSLQCSHSFCQLCIEKWMKLKKECPNCRKKVESKVRSIVLDNYIDKVTDFLSEELKESRKTLIEQRKGMCAFGESHRAVLLEIAI